MSPFDSLWCDEIPEEALTLIERFELSGSEARGAVEGQASQIRSRAEADIDGLRRQADEAIRAQADILAREIKPLMEGYAKAGKVGEILAIRDRLRRMRAGLLEVMPDPGVTHPTPADFGKTFLYEVSAEPNARNAYLQWPVYGTDIYCGDSSLVGACIHAGVLRRGEKRVIQVTVLDEPHACFQGSSRNGVMSWPWEGAYPAFRVAVP